jgi:hypothetical protein
MNINSEMKLAPKSIEAYAVNSWQRDSIEAPQTLRESPRSQQIASRQRSRLPPQLEPAPAVQP